MPRASDSDFSATICPPSFRVTGGFATRCVPLVNQTNSARTDQIASFLPNFVNSSHEIGFRWSAGLFVRHKPGKFICGADAVEVDYEIGFVDKHRDLR